MTIVGAFVSALVTTALQGGMANYIFKRFASERIAAVAAFWLTLGTAGGRYGYSGAPDAAAAVALAAISGAGLALFLLWLWLLKQHPGAADNGAE